MLTDRLQTHLNRRTCYLTRGWFKVGDSSFAEYERIARKHSREFAEGIIRLMLNNYTRRALINTSQYELGCYRDYARYTVERFGLQFEEIERSTALVHKMVCGPWDDGFIVVAPDKVIRFEDFFPSTS